MLALVCALSIATSLLAADNNISRAEAQEGWILLFDGQSSFGWTRQGKGNWKIANSVLSFDGGDPGVLQTNAAFSDFILKLDFRSSSDPDSAVLLRISKDGPPQETGYELRLDDSDSKWPAGSVVKMFKADGKLQLNQWHTLEAELSADHISVKIDKRKAGEASDAKSKAGFIALAGNKGSAIEFRNIKLKPIGTRALFNGSDLSGWKSVGETPANPKGGGLFKKFGKVFKPGEGKPKEAEWTVANGVIHGMKGPGQLESQAAYDDFVLQIDIQVNSKNKKQHPKTAVLVRSDPGKFQTGYEMQIENEVATGGIAGFKPRQLLGSDNEFFTETIAARGRHFQIWVNGYPVNEYDDTRPEGMAPKKEARTAAGAIALLAPDGDSNLDFKNIKIEALPQVLGGHPGAVVAAAAPAVISPPPAVIAPPPAVPPQIAAPPQTIVLNPNQAKEDAKQAQVARLTTQALDIKDPAEQARLYKNILSIDPNNVNAREGYRDAQQKIEQAKAQQQKQIEEQARQSQDAAQKAAAFDQALKSGEAAFVVGDLATAQSQLAIAQRIAPNNPQIQHLQSLVGSAVQARNRIKYLAFGCGFVVLLGAGILVIAGFGKKEPYLEVVEGLDKDRRYKLDQEVVHIGAIAQDGGSKNDIVLQDPDQMISRFHCEVLRKGSKLFLVDLNSANGTFLDKKQIPPGRPVRLKKGARVGLAGTCALRVGLEKKKKKG